MPPVLHRQAEVRGHRGPCGSVPPSPREDRADPADVQEALTAVTCVTFDCSDPDLVATFWAGALGWHKEGHTVRRDDGFFLEFCPVDDPKVAKNRVHLGLHTDDLDAEIERLEALGARCLWEELLPREWPFRNAVLCDPEGNEFCLGAEGKRPGL